MILIILLGCKKVRDASGALELLPIEHSVGKEKVHLRARFSKFNFVDFFGFLAETLAPPGSPPIHWIFLTNFQVTEAQSFHLPNPRPIKHILQIIWFLLRKRELFYQKVSSWRNHLETVFESRIPTKHVEAYFPKSQGSHKHETGFYYPERGVEPEAAALFDNSVSLEIPLLHFKNYPSKREHTSSEEEFEVKLLLI